MAGAALVLLVFAAIAWAFHRNARARRAGAAAWVLFTGGFAALGALGGGGHPLSILAAFIAAPIKPFRPGIPAGGISAMAEAWLRRPRVVDFDSLRDDIVHWSGWWKNRVARTLLNFLLVTWAPSSASTAPASTSSRTFSRKNEPMKLPGFLSKPRWLSKDAETRRRAVQHDQDSELVANLSRLAREDTDAGVRVAAMKRLADPGIAQGLAHDDTDPAVRAQARALWFELLTGSHPAAPALAERLRLLKAQDDGELIEHIARRAPGGRTAWRRTRAQARARRRCSNARWRSPTRPSGVRWSSASTTRRNSPRLAERARKSDKQVSRLARERIDTLRIARGDNAIVELRARQLCEQLEQLVRDAGHADAEADIAVRWARSNRPSPNRCACAIRRRASCCSPVAIRRCRRPRSQRPPRWRWNNPVPRTWPWPRPPAPRKPPRRRSRPKRSPPPWPPRPASPLRSMKRVPASSSAKSASGHCRSNSRRPSTRATRRSRPAPVRRRTPPRRRSTSSGAASTRRCRAPSRNASPQPKAVTPKSANGSTGPTTSAAASCARKSKRCPAQASTPMPSPHACATHKPNGRASTRRKAATTRDRAAWPSASTPPVAPPLRRQRRTSRSARNAPVAR